MLSQMPLLWFDLRWFPNSEVSPVPSGVLESWNLQIKIIDKVKLVKKQRKTHTGVIWNGVIYTHIDLTQNDVYNAANYDEEVKNIPGITKVTLHDAGGDGGGGVKGRLEVHLRQDYIWQIFSHSITSSQLNNTVLHRLSYLSWRKSTFSSLSQKYNFIIEL